MDFVKNISNKGFLFIKTKILIKYLLIKNALLDPTEVFAIMKLSTVKTDGKRKSKEKTGGKKNEIFY